MKKIEAKIIADSINPWEDRITTMMLTFPRFILPELNTHRVFSKNSASSRAIPFKKMVEMVEEDPFIPIAWQKDHKGMQGDHYIRSANGIEHCRNLWLDARNSAVIAAKNLRTMAGRDGMSIYPGTVEDTFSDFKNDEEILTTKQLCNRVLEPYMWHTVLLTATDFDNFFELRCPCYVFNYYPENRPEALEPSQSSFKSKKDLIRFADKYGYHLGTSQELNSYHFWAELNCSEAEIHMQELAECMWDARNESIPVKLESGQWHIPFGDKINLPSPIPIESGLTLEQGVQMRKAMIATARCARLSYGTMDGKIDYDKDIELHNRLLDSEHMSPFEHCARAMSDEELDNYMVLEDGHTTIGRCRNFKGFIQYRKIVEDAKKY